MNEVKVTVCVAVYNAERYIGRCAESLLSQTMTEGVEFLFVDDGSTDHSIAELRREVEQHPEMESHVRIEHHGKNMGLKQARRTLVEHALGEWVVFVDADDWVESDLVESLYAKTGESVDVVLSDFYEHKPGRTEIVRNVAPPKSTAERLMSVLTDRTSDYIWGKLIRRSVLMHSSCWSPTSYLEDQHITYKLYCEARDIANTGKPLYHYDRTNPGSMSLNIGMRQMEELVEGWEYNDRIFADYRLTDDVAEGVAYQKVSNKAVAMLFCHGLAPRRKYADIFREEEERYAGGLSRGYRLMLWLVSRRLWPLVWLYSCYIVLRGWLTRLPYTLFPKRV